MESTQELLQRIGDISSENTPIRELVIAVTLIMMHEDGFAKELTNAYDWINNVIADCIDDVKDGHENYEFMPHELIAFLDKHQVKFDPEYNL